MVLGKDESSKDFKAVHKEWPADNSPFIVASTPIGVRATGRKVPSRIIDQYDLCNELPEVDTSRGEKEEIILILMRAVRLHVSAFLNTRE